MGLDPLPPAQVVDCDLAAEALQNNSDLLFGGVLTSGSRLHARAVLGYEPEDDSEVKCAGDIQGFLAGEGATGGVGRVGLK